MNYIKELSKSQKRRRIAASVQIHLEEINIENFLASEDGPTFKHNSDAGNSDLKIKLTQWSLKHKITHVALNDLLQILQPMHCNLPKDSRTLLATPRIIEIDVLSNGSYHYFGLLRGIHQACSSGMRPNLNTISLDINIDGLSLYKSSNASFWPIIGRVWDSICKKPFLIGIFCGNGKPCPIVEYLTKFIVEINELVQNGFNYKGKHINLKIRAFICDAPARSFLKCIKAHTGYFSCEKCTVEGEWFKDRMIFTSLNSVLRTDKSFRDVENEEHHIGISPLLEIQSLGMVSNFPLDYMHLICLGVTRKLLITWINGKNKRVRLHSKVVDKISEQLIDLAPHIPLEFNRKPRSLKEIKRWKATEMRQFLSLF